MTPSVPRHDWIDTVYCPHAAETLSAALELPLPAAALLAARGLEACEPARRFLSPRLSELSDPMRMADMPQAVDRLIEALDKGEPMVVFADFDADGVSAAAVLAGVLQRLGGHVSVFHPERIEEGYGLTRPALERCLGTFPEARLMVTVDCGIRAHAEIRAWRQGGRDVIVTDHHELSETLPAANAVVNPRRGDPDDAAADLAGVGVAFKLCHALVKCLRERNHPSAMTLDLREWLDIVAVGTVADVVPLRGENRTLVSAGLKRLSSRPSPGLKALMQRAGLRTEHLSSHDLGFVLGPRLNAAGRMERADTASALLLTADSDLARRHAALLEQLNARRRSVEREILQAALAQLEAFDPGRDGALTVGAPDWHPGAIGIVAARLAERFHRPAAVIALAPDGTGRGSVRSAAGVNVLQALQACANWTDRAGGHRSAAGLSLKAGALDAFRTAFSQACRQQIPDGDTRSGLQIDGWLDPERIDGALLDAQTRLEPFGEGNPLPCWALSGVRPVMPPRRIGGDGAHLSLTLQRPGGPKLEAIGFNLGTCRLPNEALDVAFTLHRDRWQGRTRIQLRLLDLRPHAPCVKALVAQTSKGSGVARTMPLETGSLSS